MAKGPTGVGPDLAYNHGTLTPLTGASGSVGTAIVAVGATYDATAQGIVNDNFRRLEDKLNQIIVILQNMGAAG